jgi:transcriptional regulator GlxA family with amidase domain
MPWLPPGSGAQIVGLCLGTYVLAYAGLLDGRGAATHWEFEQEFVQRFPRVRLDTNALYVDDDGLITSAGTAASLDCCLYLVRQHHGSQIANKLARRLVVLPTGRVARPSSSSSRYPPPPGMPINQLFDHLRLHLAAPSLPWTARRNIA